MPVSVFDPAWLQATSGTAVGHVEWRQQYSSTASSFPIAQYATAIVTEANANYVVGSVTHWAYYTTTGSVRACNVREDDWVVYHGWEDSSLAEQATPASMRALELLRDFLTEAQRRSMEDHRWFIVKGSKGRRYRVLTHSASANIWELDAAGASAARWCAHPRDVPLGDQLLAQKLLIETDEDEFRKVAVEHWRRETVAA